MIKVLFVCHGNICRSPMAEYILKDIVQRRGFDDDFYIASAATSTEEIGNPVYPPVRHILQLRGINCDEKRAVQVKKSDYNLYDYIICMDTNNLRNIMQIMQNDTGNKISLLMDFTDTPHNVADPWYTRDFETTLQDIENGCAAFIQKVYNH